MIASKENIQDFLKILLIFLFTVTVYAKVFHNDFIWEDKERILYNSTLKNVEGLKRIWVDFRATYQYYPLTHSAFWLEYQFFKVNPLGYHVINVLLHAFNAAILFILLKRLKFQTAFFVSLIFALHPVHVESVAWICELKNLLSALFVLFSLLFYGGYKGLYEANYGNKGILYFLSFVLFIFAVLSKSVVCVLPAVMLILLFWKKGIVKKDIWELIPFFLVSILAAGLTIWLEKFVVGASGQDWQLTAFERITIALKAFWFYPYKLLWPFSLTFFYPQENWLQLAAQDCLIWLSVILIIIFAPLKVKRNALAALLLYGVIIFPALGFFDLYPMRFSYVADHYQYLASIPFIVLLAETFNTILRRINERRISRGIVFAGMLFFLSWQTFNQIKIYLNDETLFSDVLKKNPANAYAHNNLGVYLVDEGRVEEAVESFERAVDYKPSYIKAKLNLAYAYQKIGRGIEAQHILLELKNNQ